MRLLHTNEPGKFSLTEDLPEDRLPPYAILSHRWLADTEEPTFEDLVRGTGRDKLGYKKLQFCGEQARQDGIYHFWVDTCCINKDNKAELAQAIKCMFRWYRDARVCYVYLSDVSGHTIDSGGVLRPSWCENGWPRSEWFTRGWTLQELLAPRYVKFFTREGRQFGDKRSLERALHEITGIPNSALQGTPLSQFTIQDRLSWITTRTTSLEEDKAYSLLGIFDVDIAPLYGLGNGQAFTRLMNEINSRDKCIRDLHLTDPRKDKQRIEDTKGGLLDGCYYWILENSDFHQWRESQQSRLLWINGDPGKGKTMLLCGIINELQKSEVEPKTLSYFFCQASDSRINNATAVLRGLMYLLVQQQPSLTSHIREDYDLSGKKLFEDANAWVALSKIFVNLLQDPRLHRTYLVIDALDECAVGLESLLDLIARTLSISTRVKWIVSSRNWPKIEERLEKTGDKLVLSLELNAQSVSEAVSTFIECKVRRLAEQKRYSDKTRAGVLNHLSRNANNTFLWVALVCQYLEKTPRWDTLAKLVRFPPGLDSLYGQMLEQVYKSDCPDLCKTTLATIAVVYRPVTLKELAILIEAPEDLLEDLTSVWEIVSSCGSFLTVREDTVYFVHLSVKDFLLTAAFDKIFPSGKEEIHCRIFSRSIQVMSKTLKRDIYSLCSPGYPINEVMQPNPDPLATVRYSCLYWISHLSAWNFVSPRHGGDGIPNGGVIIDNFLRTKYLYWLEALSLCQCMSECVLSMARLEALLQEIIGLSALLELVRDARRFVMYFKQAIEENPLQAYASALLFSPARSIIRGRFQHKAPRWITIKPPIRDEWSACLQTLEGHSDSVSSVAFSYDSTRLASASHDSTVKIWDASSGRCLQTLEGHSNWVTSVAFSYDSTRLASASDDRTVKIWDASSGRCLQTLEGYSDWVTSVAFSHDSTRLASASHDSTVKIWDASSGRCLQTLEGHSDWVTSVAFSYDSTRLASASHDSTVKIWDASSGRCLQTLEGHSGLVSSVAFSYDSTRLVSASHDSTVKIWDASSGRCLQTLEGHNDWVTSVAFSYDSTRLASASYDSTVKIWDASSGRCLQTLEGHSDSVRSVAFSYDSTRLASASHDRTVKIWDASSGRCLQTLEGHSGSVISVAFSYDSTRLASASHDSTVKIWDASSGRCLQTLEGHSDWVTSVAFSYDSTRLASASHDSTVKIWDASSGRCLQTLEGHSGLVSSVAFSYDSTRLVSASHDSTVKIWDASSGRCLQTLEGHSGWVSSVAFSYDSTRLASASHDRTVKIWDASSGRCLQTLEGHSGSVSLVAFSYDSTRLVSASHNSTVKIWDASSGRCLQTLEGHSGWVSSVAFSYDSTRLASASYDSTVKIWDASRGGCLQTLQVGKTLFDISFDATGSYLRTETGSLSLVNSPPLDTTETIVESQDPEYRGVGVSPDGAWITYNSEKVVWLPSEYRPSCSAVSVNTIGVGVGSGKVWICSFDAQDSSRSLSLL